MQVEGRCPIVGRAEGQEHEQAQGGVWTCAVMVQKGDFKVNGYRELPLDGLLCQGKLWVVSRDHGHQVLAPYFFSKDGEARGLRAGKIVKLRLA